MPNIEKFDWFYFLFCSRSATTGQPLPASLPGMSNCSSAAASAVPGTSSTLSPMTAAALHYNQSAAALQHNSTGACYYNPQQSKHPSQDNIPNFSVKKNQRKKFTLF